MKTKTKSPAPKLSLTLPVRLDEPLAYLLRACAAYDGQTPEEYALAALRGHLSCTAEAIGSELRD